MTILLQDRELREDRAEVRFFRGTFFVIFAFSNDSLVVFFGFRLRIYRIVKIIRLSGEPVVRVCRRFVGDLLTISRGFLAGFLAGGRHSPRASEARAHSCREHASDGHTQHSVCVEGSATERGCTGGL